MTQMGFALSISDISLWLAVTAIILLLTSELIYVMPGLSGRIAVSRSRLRLAALGLGLTFLFTVVMRAAIPF